LRITQEAAGVDRMPPCPTITLADAVGGGHAQDDLDRLAVVEATVAAEHQGAARQPAWVSKIDWTKFSR
jgi:hypothetical protein